MDTRGEAFVRLRDALERLGLPEGVAINIARHQLKALNPLLLTIGQDPTSSTALRREVSRRAERLLEPLIQEAQEKVALFRLLVADAKSLFEGIEAAMLGLLSALLRKWEGTAASMTLYAYALAAGSGTAPAPPLALQEKAGGPVRLVFWEPAARLCTLMSFAFPMWVEWAEGRAEGDVEPPPQGFAEAWRLLQGLLPCLSAFARLQWRAAGIVGSLCGDDGIGTAWLQYAEAFEITARERLKALLEGGSTPRITLDFVVTPQLDIVMRTTSYILHGEPLNIPDLARAELRYEGRVIGGRVILNHPLVGLKRACGKVQECRRAFGAHSYPLSATDEAFLELLRAFGKEPGQRLPKGFWELFQAEWAKRFPDKPMTVNNLRVRYHRLVRRIRGNKREG